MLVTIKNSSIKEILEEDRSVSSIKSRSMNLYAFETFDLKEGDKIMSLDFSKIFTYYGGN